MLTGASRGVSSQHVIWNRKRSLRIAKSTVRSFAFTDSEGKAFDSASLRGKIWAINFFFTSCKGICPTVSSSIARLSKVFEKSHEVEFVSLSIDPETDTSEVLGKYAQKYNANSKRWHFLTGNKSAIDEVINKGFQLGNGDKLDEHSGRVVLVDKLGRVRGYYQGTDAEAIEKLENDLSTLLDSN